MGSGRWENRVGKAEAPPSRPSGFAALRLGEAPRRAGLWCTGSEGWLGVGEVFPSLAFGLRCAPGFAALRRDETP